MKIQWLLIWTLLHTTSMLLVSYITSKLNILNPFIKILVIAFGVTFLANVYRKFTQKYNFIVDSLFIFWIAINSITIWLVTLLNNRLNVNNVFVSSIIIGFGLVISSYLTHFFHLLRLKGLKLWMLIIVIIAILFFVHGNSISDTSPNTAQNLSAENIVKNFEGTISNIKENIKTAVSEIKENLDPKSFKNIQEAFEELNNLRNENGVSKLRWDDNINELVKFQASKGLCSTSYCDHIDSSGKYFDAYAGKFGVSLLGRSAENIAGSDCHQAVTDLWLHSTTGHRENMLNPVMHKGALAYDKGNCVLIVTS